MNKFEKALYIILLTLFASATVLSTLNGEYGQAVFALTSFLWCGVAFGFKSK